MSLARTTLGKWSFGWNSAWENREAIGKR